ncbi:MAG: T9SS type A sorting domain-containing protein [Bacteroidetes bacterium]|nr:T9SS type A sorting domain-containing protein [Bacteroidota bacterium]
MTGANGFANLSVLKTANSVILANNIDVKENFATLSATSIFNIGGKYMKVAGNFTNNTSPTTFTGVGGSTVEFNGAGNQFLNNINGATGITMNRVFMNKTGGKLYLSSANSSLNVDSILTLTSGNIVTRNFASTQVFVKYGISAAITGHSALSYIDGKLRRAVYTGTPLTLPFSLDYPVGDSLLQGGYELANVTFTGGTVIPDLQGTFNPWAIPATPPLGPIANECMIANYNPNPFFNHGYWTFSKTNPTPFNGIYRLTMNNIGYNNNAGFNGWTVAKADIAADPNLTASWSLIGQCAIASTATVTQRVNINGTNPYSVTTTLGSNIIYTSNTTALSTGAAITGTGIPAGSVITAILNSGAFTISNPATASGTVTGSIGSTANSATSFNHHYAIAQSTVPLPIELLSFTAEPEKDYVVCNWTTASETNNAYFEVLRSFDGKEFNAIGNVNGFGAGTSTTNRSYSFVDDEERCNSIRYYQLKQFDIDNKSTLSDIVAVNCNNKDETISIYPNPATETLTYQFYQNGDEVLEVQIVDMTGRTVFIENTVAIRGFNSTTVSIENLAGGAYNLLIRSLNTKNSTSPRHAQFFKK